MSDQREQTRRESNDRCDRCGVHISEWNAKPCVKSLTQSPGHTITRFYLEHALADSAMNPEREQTRRDAPRIYESIIKVVVSDPPERRRRDIEDGIGYACALLMDEYGASAEQVQDVLERATDDAWDHEVTNG